MMRRCLALAVGAALTAGAQSAPVVPARAMLAVRDDLQLSTAQIARLRSLEAAQTATMNRATAAYLRAEADLLDAIRLDSLPLRRAALERRAKVAIDAEMARLQADREARAVLLQEQRDKLATLPRQSEALVVLKESAIWDALVAPPPATRLSPVVVDSAEVRITVTPTWADIYIDSTKVGTGKKFLWLPVGGHSVLVHAVGCKDALVNITVEKGPAMIVTQTLNCSEPSWSRSRSRRQKR